MPVRTSRWMRDKQNAKIGGVLAGFAAWTGFDVGAVRLVFICASVILPVAVPGLAGLAWIAYFGLMFGLPVKPVVTQVVTFDRAGNLVTSSSTETLAATWRRYHLIEQRMARIEQYYLDRSRSLARQIDALANPNIAA